MKIDNQTIEKAFEQHHKRYVSVGGKAWDIKEHVKYWGLAHQAFEQDSLDKFKDLYAHLRREWQVFRGVFGEPWDARQTFDTLGAFPQTWREKCLSQLSHTDVHECGKLLDTFSGIKPLKHGKSVVAISKFLHFWNPKLFVIVDRAAMWQWVFGHKWLGDSVTAFARGRLGLELVSRPDQCGLQWYVCILFWSGQMLRANPEILQCFADYVRDKSKDIGRDLPLESYEAAAMEWLLLGLAELPPAGARLE